MSRLAPSKRLRKIESARQHLRDAAQQLRDLHDDNVALGRLNQGPRCALPVAQACDAAEKAARDLAEWATLEAVTKR